ncbi:MAG: hypothetical protein LC772_12725, partial [Chloroflexi bacterium]|nr:hypothetical protein [Chloroflexota bacterium]
IFSRFFGWAYGFGSVALFRTLLSVGSPLAVQLLGRYVPPALQPYLKVQPKASLFSLKYLRSRDFWYGPGMGMVGGAVGAILRHIVLGR